MILDLGPALVDGGLGGVGDGEGCLGLCLVFQCLGLGRVDAGRIGVNGCVNFLREALAEFREALFAGDDGRMVLRVFLAEADEVDFLIDDGGADFLHVTIVVDVVGNAARFDLAELRLRGSEAGLILRAANLDVLDGLVEFVEFADSLFRLLVRGVHLVLLLVVGELLAGVLGLLLGLRDALIQEFDQEALGLLILLGLHVEEVVDDFLRDLLGFLRGTALCLDLDQVRALRILDVQIFLRERLCVWTLVFLLVIEDLVDDRLEDGTALHQGDVVLGRARLLAEAGRGHHLGGAGRDLHVPGRAAGLHGRRRLPLFRQDKRDEDGEDGAADDDAAHDFLPRDDDTPQFGEVDAFFFFQRVHSFSLLSLFDDSLLVSRRLSWRRRRRRCGTG